MRKLLYLLRCTDIDEKWHKDKLDLDEDHSFRCNRTRILNLCISDLDNKLKHVGFITLHYYMVKCRVRSEN